MTEITAVEIRPGDKIKVQWGKWGMIEVVVFRVSPRGNLFVRRWRPKMRNYTNPRRAWPNSDSGYYVKANTRKAAAEDEE